MGAEKFIQKFHHILTLIQLPAESLGSQVHVWARDYALLVDIKSFEHLCVNVITWQLVNHLVGVGTKVVQGVCS